MANISRRKFIKGLALTAIPTPVLAANATSVSSGLSTTPAEIKGPFYPVTAQHDRDIDLTTIKGRDGGAEGDVIFVEGRVVDTQGAALEGAVIDLWQANAFGRYSHPRDPNPAARDPDFQGWAIFLSRSGGYFRFKTVMPGAYPAAPNWMRAPHIHFKLTKPGFRSLTTQMYFADQPLNQSDLLLQRKSPAEQRLMTAPLRGTTTDTYEYQIVLAHEHPGGR